MTNIFEGRKFDMDVFVNYPKCRGRFSDGHGAGCLFTAVFVALGFEVGHDPYYLKFDDMTITQIFNQFDDFCRSRETLRDPGIMTAYDTGDTLKAVSSLFHLLRLVGLYVPAESQEIAVLGTKCMVGAQ